MHSTRTRRGWAAIALAGLWLVPAVASAQYGYDNPGMGSGLSGFQSGAYSSAYRGGLDGYRGGVDAYSTFGSRQRYGGMFNRSYNPYSGYGMNPYGTGGYNDRSVAGWYYDYYDPGDFGGQEDPGQSQFDSPDVYGYGSATDASRSDAARRFQPAGTIGTPPRSSTGPGARSAPGTGFQAVPGGGQSSNTAPGTGNIGTTPETIAPGTGTENPGTRSSGLGTTGSGTTGPGTAGPGSTNPGSGTSGSGSATPGSAGAGAAGGAAGGATGTR
jgi:hypothetical protein